MPWAIGRRGGRLGSFGAAALAVVLPAVLAAALAVPVRAAEPGPDLSAVAITPEDLPTGFTPSPEQAASFLAAAEALTTTLDTSPGLHPTGATLLVRGAGTEREFVAVVLLTPLSAGDQARFDTEVATPAVAAQLDVAIGGATSGPLAVPSVGTSRLGMRIEAAGGDVVEELVVFRRGPVLALAGHAWITGTTTIVTLGDVARLLDRRLVAVTGVEPPLFRAPGLLVPALTTRIPTPLDVSTDPAVAGTNLFLAALALLLLTVTARLATQMADRLEGRLARIAIAWAPVLRARRRLAGVGGRLPARRLAGALRPLSIACFYGVVFAALDSTWDPLSATGVWLLVSMTIACGVVGLGDDLVQWRLARRMQLPASLGVRPSGAVAALASLLVSRATAVVPGLMFGTPEALRLDDDALDPERSARLSTAGFVSLAAVGSASWSATVGIEAAARSGGVPPALAGLEALLLLVYAAALQNLFVAMLGFAGSAGQRLRRRSRVIWGAALLLVTFLFWHTLLNPAGDPSIALASRNVQVVLAIVGAFSALTVGVWLVVHLAEAAEPHPGAIAAPGTATARSAPPAPAGDAPAADAPAFLLPASPQPAVAPPSAMPPRPTEVPSSFSPAEPPPLPTGVATAFPALPLVTGDVVLASADGRLRGPVLLRFAGPWVASRVEFVDPVAVAQQRAFTLLSGLAVVGTFLAYAGWLAGREPPDAAVAGLLCIVPAWVVAIVVGRLWLERHRVVHTAVFPAAAIERVTVGRDWTVAIVLGVLLTPLVGLLYAGLARKRIVGVRAPFLVDRRGSQRLRLAGTEDEGRRLERLVLGGSAASG